MHLQVMADQVFSSFCLLAMGEHHVFVVTVIVIVFIVFKFCKHDCFEIWYAGKRLADRKLLCTLPPKSIL